MPTTNGGECDIYLQLGLPADRSSEGSTDFRYKIWCETCKISGQGEGVSAQPLATDCDIRRWAQVQRAAFVQEGQCPKYPPRR